jgi:hypothetical protein
MKWVPPIGKLAIIPVGFAIRKILFKLFER